MPATVTYRRLDPVTGEPVYGGGQSNFLTDIDAVAQMILTRLKLLQGEWWESLGEGTPLFQDILGASAGDRGLEAASTALQARINDTKYVTGISNVQVGFDHAARRFTFSCSVTTQFGTLLVSNTPGLSAVLGSA